MKGKSQNLYKYSVILAGMISIAGISAFLLSLVEKSVITLETMIIVVSSLVLVFLVLNVAIRLLNRGPLQFPFNTRFQHIISVLAVALFVITAGYGIYRWPYAPLRKVDSIYKDKREQCYTSEEYAQFKRWEFAFLAFGLPFALVAITSIPSNPKFKQRRHG